MPNRDCCKDCKFSKMNGGEPVNLVCRRYPPAHWQDSGFPPTKPDSWCGEFKKA